MLRDSETLNGRSPQPEAAGMTLPQRSRLVVILLPLAAVALASDATAQERESILDRIVHIEEGVLTEIPETPRLENGLDLTIRRIDVGDAELYV